MKKTNLVILFYFLTLGLQGQFSAAFTADKTVGCAPLIVNFKDNSNLGVTSWTWTSSAGISSDKKNPSLIFSQPGIHTVTLIASNGVETDTATSTIRVTPGLDVDFSTNASVGCAPFSAQFNDLSVPQSSSIKEWFWSFSNGFTSTTQNPTVTFTDSGKYDILLKVTDANGCESSKVKSGFITVGKPSANFLFDSISCSVPWSKPFVNASQGNNLLYDWNFGNGNTSSAEIPPLQIYNNFDTVPITLKVTESNSLCTDSIRKLLYLKKYEAKMKVNVSCTATDFTMTFEDQTSPEPESVRWKMGDETEYISSSFSHTFSGTASKTISLTAKQGTSCENTVSLNYEPPKASFSLVTQNKCDTPYVVSFSNFSQGIGLQYSWDFGSGDESSDTNPSYNFNIPPVVYTTSLFVTDSFGCTSSQSRRIEIPIPVTEFTTRNSTTTGCAPLSVTFVDSSLKLFNPVKSVKWNFGDPSSGSENTSNDTLVTHVFNNPGIYDITFIVLLENGCTDTIVKKEFVRVGEPAQSVDFSINFSTDICYGETLEFESMSTFSNPTYNPDFFCWAFEEKKDPLLINNNTAPTLCPKAITNFLPSDKYVNNETPSHKYDNYKYNDPVEKDGYNYTGTINPDTGILYTHLILGYNGCYQEISKEVNVNSTVAMLGFAFDDSLFVLTECDSNRTIGIYNASINYDSLLYFRIIYEPTLDTVALLPEQDTSFFTFDKIGNYLIQIGVHDKLSQCQHETSRTFQVLDSKLNFTLPKSVCQKAEIVVIDKSSYSNGFPSWRSWALQDSTLSQASFPTVTNDTLFTQVLDTGWNEITLRTEIRVEDNILGEQIVQTECSYFYSDSVYVEGFDLSIKLDTNLTCGKDSVLIFNTTKVTSPTQSLKWTLKDSVQVIGTSDTIKVAYNEPGTYFFELEIANQFGCVDTIVSEPLSVSLPILKFEGDTVICEKETVTFDNKSKGNVLEFTWTIEETNYSNISAIHTFSTVDTVDVHLKAVDKYGCTDSITYKNYVRVSPYPKSEFYTLDVEVNCPPFSVQFFDSSKTPATEWKWEISDGGNATTQNFLHTFLQAGDYDVTFTSTNKDGCTNDTLKPNYVSIKGPSAAVETMNTTVCAPDSINFKMEFKDAEYYVWDFGDGVLKSGAVNSNRDSIIHHYTSSGVIQPTFTVIDTNECAFQILGIPHFEMDNIQAAFDIDSASNCSLDSVRFTNESLSYYPSTYQWNFGDGKSASDSITVHSYDSPDNYAITLSVENSKGCRDSVTKNHKIFSAPEENLTIDNDYFCIPMNTVLKLNYQNSSFLPEEAYFIAKGQKRFGDSTIIEYSKAGVYPIQYRITYGEGKCFRDSSFSHEYFDLPIANFDYSPKNISVETTEINFSSNSSNEDVWNWNFGDNSTVNIENPTHNYNTAGKYTVQLIVSNDGKCTDTAKVELTVAPSDLIRLPNAFSPDGDGYNDKFGILYAGEMDVLSFLIFNRWGNVVFRTRDISEKWDGRFNGKLQSHGTYVYYVKGRNRTGEIVEYKGNFSLIR